MKEPYHISHKHNCKRTTESGECNTRYLKSIKIELNFFFKILRLVSTPTPYVESIENLVQREYGHKWIHYCNVSSETSKDHKQINQNQPKLKIRGTKCGIAETCGARGAIHWQAQGRPGRGGRRWALPWPWPAMSKEDHDAESEEQPVDTLRHLKLPRTGQGRQTTIPHFWESFGPKPPLF